MNVPPFEWLECLLAAGDSKNLTEAASRIGLSQPALSVKLLRLEESVPVPLFQWDGRRKVLTPYGRALCEVVRKEQKDVVDGYVNVNRAYASPEHLTLKIACRAELFELVAPWFTFPGRILLDPISSPESIQRLLSHHVDVAVTHQVPESSEMTARSLVSSLVKVAVHQKWIQSKLSPLMKKTGSLLKDVPCIVYDEAGHLLADWAKAAGLSFADLRVALVVKDWRLIRSLVEQGLGFALVPDYLKFSSANVETLLVPEDIVPRFTFYGVYSKSLKKIPGFQPLPILSRPRSKLQSGGLGLSTQ